MNTQGQLHYSAQQTLSKR
jgi:hypothetical protein